MPTTSHFLKIHCNIIFPPNPGCSKWTLSLRFSYQNPVYTSPLLIHATCPTHLIILDLITRTILGEQYRSLSTSVCSFLHSPVTSSHFYPNILLSIVFSNTSSLNVSDQVSHPYKTTGKIVVLWVLTFIFLGKTGRQKICIECADMHVKQIFVLHAHLHIH